MQSWTTFSVCEHLSTGFSLQEERSLLGCSTIKTPARGPSVLLKVGHNEDQRAAWKKNKNHRHQWEGELCRWVQQSMGPLRAKKYSHPLPEFWTCPKDFTWSAKAENLTLTEKVTTPKIYLILFCPAHENTWEDQSFSLGLEGIKSQSIRKVGGGGIKKTQTLLISSPAKMYYLKKK